MMLKERKKGKERGKGRSEEVVLMEGVKTEPENK